MAVPAVAYLSVDVVALTGVTESYLAHLCRSGIVVPRKARNAKTNLFTAADIDRIRWAMENRGRLSVEEMRTAVTAAGAAR
jgi:DNA-binding transcriptional MerR regulator